MEEKKGLRRWARSLPPPSDTECALVVGHLREWLSVLAPSMVLVYVSMPGELPADRVVDGLDGRHHFATTRTPDQGWLSVHDFAAPREQHRFGYEQPVPTAPEIDPGRIDAVLVPGLCFDRRGGRLGWGRGYYDQLLTRMRPDVWTVGVTLERRIVDSVPSEPHDMKMTMLATEEGLFRCSSI